MKCDREQLISYLYDDVSAAERLAFERHLRGCAECHDELVALRGLRSTLSAWTPPQPELAFEVVDHRIGQPRPRTAGWRAWWTPAAGLAAAAALVLAAASALAHLEIRYGSDGFSVRTGWNTQAAVLVPSPAPSQDAQRLEAAYADVERRLHDLESASHAPAAASPIRTASQTTAADRQSDVEILTRVRDLLAQSESRQQRELALRIAQVLRDVDAQRTADLARIQLGLGKIDAMTTADAAAHRELANYLITSTRQQK
ncbi:MAG TPA: zf-HC2 domain-containing protein [Vicinamibacterales bacterium]|jgi:hypothetical protein|nr:zf-HC2 domain-containing protein [Vicinamibacterales bacterium]